MITRRVSGEAVPQGKGLLSSVGLRSSENLTMLSFLLSIRHLCVLDQQLPYVTQVAVICQDQGWDHARSIWGEAQKCQRRRWEEVTSRET